MGFRELALAGLAVATPLAGALAQPMGVHPGQWESEVTVTSMVAPNAPPAVVKAMKGRMNRVSHCITPEQAARGPQEMLKSSKTCSFTRYSMTGGRLSAQMQCQRPGGTMTADIEGTYGPDSYTTTSHMVSTGGMAMTMTSTAAGHRVGDCQK